MGLFNKNKKEGNKEIPKFPELPKLPELPRLDDLKNLPQLPSFPRSPIGEKFSQNTIKDAIAGLKRNDEDYDANEIEEENEPQMMQQPKRNLITRELEDDEYKQFQKYERRVLETPSLQESGASYKRTEPIFVRLDKFEESLKIFEKTRGQIAEIENTLGELSRIKEQEEKELQAWEQEIQNIKKQIEKVDKDIFSRIE